MKNESKVIIKIIIFSLIFFIIGGVVGYFIGENSHKNNFREGNTNFYNNNSQINETTQSEIKYFFDNTQDSGEISTYCENNPRYCIEYCRTINPSDTRCPELITSFRGGMTAR